MHFPAVELDNAIQFSNLSRKSGFLWHGFKWACQFVCFLEYPSGLEVLAYSLDTNLNYVTTMLLLHTSLNHGVKLRQLLGERCGNFLGVYSKIDTWRLKCSLLDPRPCAEFPAKCINSIDETSKIPSWFSFGFGLFVLLYIWLMCYLLDS